MHFFKGDQQTSFKDLHTPEKLEGYPKNIANIWEMPEKWAKEGIDAALYSAIQKSIYFFKGSEFIKYEDVDK